MAGSETSPTRLVSPAGGGPASLRVRRFRLEVVEGPDRGARCEPTGDRASVGTAAGNDLVLGDNTVSRIHLEVRAEPEGFLLRDLESKNGTFLDRYRVREAYLRHGARLRLGHSVVEFEEIDGEHDFALAGGNRFGPLFGSDPAMRRVFATLERIAPTDATVLVQGETGTGKELVARAMHEQGTRAQGPFVVVDAGSLPATLVESELFGHERGAFTGAVSSRAGAFEQADGGTVFLDEIGELPLDLQPKLLRLLEQREVRRVGGSEVRKIDVRVVAATNRDLRSEVNRGTFRADLYYRLAVVTIHLPPLRERPEDIPLLVRVALDQIGERTGRKLDVTDATLAKLQGLPWHGNVRELRNFVERAVWLADGDVLGTGDLVDDASRRTEKGAARVEATPSEATLSLPYKVAKAAWVDRFEEAYLPALLERCGGNVSKAARDADVDRAYLIRLLHRYGIK